MKFCWIIHSGITALYIQVITAVYIEVITAVYIEVITAL
jgi:hypothetical protein